MFFCEEKDIPVYAVSSLQRCSVILSSYDYIIKFIKSEDNSSDALSRLPLSGVHLEESDDLAHFLYIQEEVPIDFKQVARETKKDHVLN